MLYLWLKEGFMENIPKAKFREAVFLILYSLDFSKEADEQLLHFVGDQLKVGMRHIKEANLVVASVLSRLSEIDARIEGVSTEYEIHRIPKVELNILRLAIYELLFDETIPHQVAMAEAIRLAKKFGNQECFKFVNALLDAIYTQGSVAAL